MLQCMIGSSVRSCVVHVKYCNQLLAVDMAGVTCKELWCTCCWKMSKDIGMEVRKGTVVSFVPTLFVYFWGIPSLYVFSFFKMFFLTCFRCFFWGGGGRDIELLTPDTHVSATQMIGSDDS